MADPIKTSKLNEEAIRAKQEEMRNKKLGVGAYIALIICIVLYSGIFKDAEGALRGLDFNNWLGKFGTIGDTGKNFLGSGGVGARHALLLGMTWDAVTVSLEGAIAALNELTGQRVSDAVVDKVFEKFCVGK